MIRPVPPRANDWSLPNTPDKVKTTGKALIKDKDNAPNKVTFNHPLMPISVDNIKAEADINKNKLTINNFSATGSNSLKVTGFIDLNKQKIDTSILNIQGEASMGNFPLKFTLTGPARMPKVALVK